MSNPANDIGRHSVDGDIQEFRGSENIRASSTQSEAVSLSHVVHGYSGLKSSCISGGTESMLVYFSESINFTHLPITPPICNIPLS